MQVTLFTIKNNKIEKFEWVLLCISTENILVSENCQVQLPISVIQINMQCKDILKTGLIGRNLLETGLHKQY